MRSKFLGRSSLLAVALAIGVGALAVSAEAGSPYRDRVYADSFGNLVIHSRAGYKRIVVGAGHLAEELSSYQQGGEDDVVYLDDEDDRDCYIPPMFLKGRSYMYGLSDGEMPSIFVECQ